MAEHLPCKHEILVRFQVGANEKSSIISDKIIDNLIVFLWENAILKSISL